jgi:hypothetical protein
MADRERVTRAIEAPVADAAKLLAESAGADLETRLAMRIDGWGRGLAAGLEELAIAVTEARRSAAPVEPNAPPTTPRPATVATDEHDIEHDEHDTRSEDDLRAEAARSREATAALREESEAS